ncbi:MULTISPECIES: TolC family outer membrane protein [unclassified Acidovorax]|uniref:TolC family outer membrane protein n=1 Tax=unclassified Acidovorax TaxID=2684926 RepID=UPI0023DE2CDC|nr:MULTISPECIES: TolC family outer membrane protein [unclassified Acidovorax]GKS87342.1 TolC family outer membrane protein [Acidovorax sp. SUPP1855]GKS96718.1 TolC family outer membrane protein [Acidovorax sp. SUPP2825]
MTTLLRCIPLSLAVAAALASFGAQAQSLSQLVEMARGYDAPFQAAKAQYDAAGSRAEQARAGLLPSAGLSAGANYAKTEVNRPPVDLSAPSQSVGLTASQPLYRPANRITFEQGQRGIDIAQAQLEGVAQDLIVRVSQAYFDVLAARDTLTFVQAQKAAVAEQLASAKRNFEVGTSTVTDSREAQARFDLVVAQEIAADNDLRVKQLALDQVVGRPGVAPQPLAQPVQLPEVAPADVGTWVRSAEELQPQVRQAAIALDVARLETKKAETGHLPTVDLQAGYSVSRNPKGTPTIPNVNSRTNNTTVGVQLTLPLFAGFSVQNRVKETLSLEDKALADLDNARRTVAQATRAAFYGVQSGQGQVRALEAAEASSQSALEANQLGYQVGVRINIDVLNSQSQLYQTKRDLAQARYNVLLGTLKLRQAAGTLSQDDLLAIDALTVR